MQAPGNGAPPLPRCGSVALRLGPSGAQMAGGQVRIAELARVLSMAMGRTVVDQTGYAELFDVQVDFMADQSTPALPPPPPGSPTADSGLPSIATALQEQLGLRLQSSRGPVDVVVIDRIERPSAN